MRYRYLYSPTFAKIASIMKTNEVSLKDFRKLYLEHTTSMRRRNQSLLGARKYRAKQMYRELVKEGILIDISK